MQGLHIISGQTGALRSADGRRRDRTPPLHGVAVSQAAPGSAAGAEAAIKAARAALDNGHRSRLAGKARAAALNKVADPVKANAASPAVIEVPQGGQPILQVRGERAGAEDFWCCAASFARTGPGDGHNATGADIPCVVLKEPVGLVSIITPQTVPVRTPGQKLSFALAAGCTCVVKPSGMTPSATAMGAGAGVCPGGGNRTVPGPGGQFRQPGALRGTTPDMAIARREVFGPVRAVLTLRTPEKVIALTDDASHGLSAGGWCDDVHRCPDFGRHGQAAVVRTNTRMGGLPEVAPGGVMQSGQGRETASCGFEEFLEVKSRVMRIGRTRAPWVNHGRNPAGRRRNQRNRRRPTCVVTLEGRRQSLRPCWHRPALQRPRMLKFCTGGHLAAKRQP